MRKIAILTILGLALIGFGCSDENADAPAGGGIHALDGSFLAGTVHGPVAKADLTVCQGCHGEPGGPGSNPQFNRGIDSQGGVGCEACHPANAAHPQDWAGPNATFHYSAGNIQRACTLCHGAALDGVGAAIGAVSCTGCHNDVATFTLDCTACHGQPPGATETVDHGNVANVGLHDVCVTCHGMKENAGRFSAVANYDLFDKATDTLGDHWDGNINMNSGVGYDPAQFGCTACHGIDGAHVLSDSGLNVVLEDYGSANVPHAIDGTFLDPANHGPAVKGADAAFPGGLIDCKACHGESGTDNPRFNVGIASQGGVGCEACHNAFTAHPAANAPDGVAWYDGTYTHSDITVVNLGTICVLCHELPDGSGPASGGVGPACDSCHPGDALANPSGCVSCHSLPPDDQAPVGSVRPNREGQHGRAGHLFFTCNACHFGFGGAGTADHFDTVAPANVDIDNTYDANGADSAVYDSGTGNCSNVNCHGGAGNVEGPWYP